MPRIKLVFTIVEPMMFPSATMLAPLKADKTETANSGREVPKETIVAPITNSDIPDSKEIEIASSTRISVAFDSPQMQRISTAANT